MQSHERIARLRALAGQLELARPDGRRDELLREVRARITDLEAGPATFSPGGAGLARALSRPVAEPPHAAPDPLAVQLDC